MKMLDHEERAALQRYQAGIWYPDNTPGAVPHIRDRLIEQGRVMKQYRIEHPNRFDPVPTYMGLKALRIAAIIDTLI